jgi:hypothetical protein
LVKDRGIKTPEDKYYQQGTQTSWTDLNTDKQIHKAQFYAERYDALKSEMLKREEQWNKIEKQYKCERDYTEDSPNSFIPISAPIINGQIASMIDQNIATKIKGIGPSDQSFSSAAQKIAEFFLKQNKIKLRLKSIIGRYLKFGTGWIALEWDADAHDGFGMPIIRNPQTTKIFVDGNIKDILDYQEAQYIIEEVGFQSLIWAREEFGDDIANHLMLNTGEPDFGAGKLDDEQFSFMYLKVWHRNNKNKVLQLLEMDDTGFVLRESDENSPYYENVCNQYPYYPIGMYQEEGEFHRFGDGQLLFFIQDTINKLYDEIITACKFTAQSRTFVDPDGAMDPDDFDSNPNHPILCYKPNQNIYVASSGTLNPVVERLVANLVNEARRVTRFSDLMTGNSPGQTITATQAGIQTNQGNTGITDKKGDVSEGLMFAVQYAINMCMELWDSGHWFRITEEGDDFEWLDATQLSRIPVLIPADEEFINTWKENFPNSEISNMPKYMQYITSEGEPLVKKAVFDIDINIGEGLPKSPMALYNVMLSLSQISLIDEQTGQPRPLITYSQFRKMMEDMLGIPFDEAMEEAKRLQTQGAITPVNGQSQQNSSLNMSGDVPGVNLNNQPKGGAMSL